MAKSRFSAQQRGNVLFIILIAVALFGLLTATITRSNQGTPTMERERGTINASDLMAYAGNVEKTVARMLGEDMSENGLSFENDVWEFYNGDPVEEASMFTGCASAACRVFDPAGGGLNVKTYNAQLISDPADEDIKSGHAGIYSMKIYGVGTAAHDLVMLFAIIDINTCKQINASIGITNPNGLPPADTWGGALLYDGSFDGPDDATDEIGDVAMQVAGKFSGCVSRSGGAYGSADNYFYQVLLPR